MPATAEIARPGAEARLANSRQTFLPETALRVSGPVVVYEFTGPFGDDRRGHVAADWPGEVYAIGKYVGVKAEQSRTSWAMRNLSTAEEAKRATAERMTEMPQGMSEGGKQHYKRVPPPWPARKRDIVLRQRQERAAFDAAQASDWTGKRRNAPCGLRLRPTSRASSAMPATGAHELIDLLTKCRRIRQLGGWHLGLLFRLKSVRESGATPTAVTTKAGQLQLR